MKWLDKFIRRAYNRAVNDECHEVACSDSSEIDCSTGRLYSRYDSSSHTRFNLFSADGGVIIETISHDNSKSRERTQLYVILDEDDLAENLKRIIILEKLKY